MGISTDWIIIRALRFANRSQIGIGIGIASVVLEPFTRSSTHRTYDKGQPGFHSFAQTERWHRERRGMGSVAVP